MSNAYHDHDADDIDIDREDDVVPDDLGDGEFEDDSAEASERADAIEKLELLMGDAQDRMAKADAGDLDPAEAYRLVFEAVGWTGADIEEAINDAEKSLEGQLYDQVGSKSYAASLLKDALATVEARMVEAAETPAPTP